MSKRETSNTARRSPAAKLPPSASADPLPVVPGASTLTPLPVPPPTIPRAAESVTLPDPSAPTKSQTLPPLPAWEPARSTPLTLPSPAARPGAPPADLPTQTGLTATGPSLALSLPERQPVVAPDLALPGLPAAPEARPLTLPPPRLLERPARNLDMPSYGSVSPPSDIRAPVAVGPPVSPLALPERGPGPSPSVFPEGERARAQAGGQDRIESLLEQILAALSRTQTAARIPAGPIDIGAGQSFAWSAPSEDYPIASPSVNVSTRSGLRGAGGKGFGSARGDLTNFLEPRK